MINKKYFFIIGVENRGEEVANLLRKNGIRITDAADKIYADIRGTILKTIKNK